MPGSDDGVADVARSLAAIGSLLSRLEQPAGGDRTSDAAGRQEQLLAALAMLRELRDTIAGWEPRLISAARDAGASWAQLAPALGVRSRQAAERRYLRLNPVSAVETTGEDRVRAVRSRRAAERAMTTWARGNATELRQLAARVSTVDGLSDQAQHHADTVAVALAGNDPAELLPLLEEAVGHLRHDHPDLADHIDAIVRTARQQQEPSEPRP